MIGNHSTTFKMAWSIVLTLCNMNQQYLSVCEKVFLCKNKDAHQDDSSLRVLSTQETLAKSVDSKCEIVAKLE
jgi:hypothetical protein